MTVKRFALATIIKFTSLNSAKQKLSMDSFSFID
jgi:hypothetical protein